MWCSVVLAVVWLLPVIYTVTTSFKSVAEFTSNAFNFLPAKWVLDNYMTLIEASCQLPGPELAGQLADYLDRVLQCCPCASSRSQASAIPV